MDMEGKFSPIEIKTTELDENGDLKITTDISTDVAKRATANMRPEGTTIANPLVLNTPPNQTEEERQAAIRDVLAEIEKGTK